MSDSKTIDPRIWNDERFHTLSPHGKLLAVYLLTGPANRIGVFKVSPALAAEDTGLSAAAVQEGLRELCEQLGWRHDADNRLMYLPTWWKYHSPSTPKQLMGILKDLHGLPESPLVYTFCENTRFLPEKLHATFFEECEKHKPRAHRSIRATEQASATNEASTASPYWAGHWTVRPGDDLLLLAREAVLSSWNGFGERNWMSGLFS